MAVRPAQNGSAGDHHRPLSKPLTMASAQDLVGMVEQMLIDQLASHKQHIEMVVRQQSSDTEKFFEEQMNSHRMWSLHNFQRLIAGSRENLSGPAVRSHSRESLNPPNTATSNLQGRSTSPDIPVTEEEGEDLISRGISMVTQSEEEKKMPIISEDAEPDIDRKASVKSVSSAGTSAELGSASFGLAHHFASGTKRSNSMIDFTGRLDFRTEKSKMEHHLERMSKAEAKASLTYQVLKRFGWDWARAKQVISKPNNFMVPIVESSGFTSGCMSVIILNAIWIGFTTDQDMRNQMKSVPADNPLWYDTVDHIFTAIFCIELFCRIFAFRRWFVIGHDRAWNLYDAFLVFCAVLEEVVEAVNVSFLRSLRILRLARVVRIIRVLRFFVGLRQLMMSIVGCAYVLSWASFCVVFLMYLFGIILLQTSILASQRRGVSLESMKEHYNGLIETMYTLLLSISNGALWEELADEYDNVVPLGRILFALYIIFVCYGILNVVTGVFVEKTAELKLRDRDLAVHKEMALTKAFLDELRELFEMETHHNKDHANEITLARFEEQLEKND